MSIMEDGAMADNGNGEWVVVYSEQGPIQWGNISSRTIRESMDTCSYMCVRFNTESDAKVFSGKASRC